MTLTKEQLKRAAITGIGLAFLEMGEEESNGTETN